MFLTEIEATEDLLVVWALEEGGLVGLQERETGVGESDGGGGGTDWASQVGGTLWPADIIYRWQINDDYVKAGQLLSLRNLI